MLELQFTQQELVLSDVAKDSSGTVGALTVVTCSDGIVLQTSSTRCPLHKEPVAVAAFIR